MYQVDNGQRDIQVGATHYMASNDSGQYLFESVAGELQYGHSGATNVKLPDDISFDDDQDRENWEHFLETEVKGDLHFETTPSTSNVAGEYDIKMVDSSGTVHHTDTAVTLPVTGYVIEDAEFEIRVPANSDFSFESTYSSRNGVSNIAIGDSAEMDQFFQDYGDVDLELTAGTPATYQLKSSKTNDYIAIGGETSWTIPATNKLDIGGLSIDLVSPVPNDTFVLSPPGPGHTVTSTSNVSSVNMVNQAAFFGEVAAVGAGAVGFEVTFTSPTQADIYAVDASGTRVGGAIVGSLPVTGTGPYTLNDNANTGLEFRLDSVPVTGEKFIVELQRAHQRFFKDFLVLYLYTCSYYNKLIV